MEMLEAAADLIDTLARTDGVGPVECAEDGEAVVIRVGFAGIGGTVAHRLVNDPDRWPAGTVVRQVQAADAGLWLAWAIVGPLA